MKKKKKVKKEKKWDWKSTDEYKLGRRDCGRMIKQFSLIVACSFRFYSGLNRKMDKRNKGLYAYCEGWADRLDKEVKNRGMTPVKDYYIDCSEICTGETI